MRNSFSKGIVTGLSVGFVPFFVLAAVQSVSGLVGNLVNVIAALVSLAIAVGVLYFMWGLVRYLLAYGDEKARRESVQTITNGLIALFVMVTVWALVELISRSLIGEGVGLPQFS